MMRNLYRIFSPNLFLGLLFFGTGCYTQLGTTRDEHREEYSSSTQNDTTGDNYEQSYADNYNDYDNGAPGYRYGFDYYYPTFGFGFSAYDPWYWGYSGWYSYDPFLCGTYYPAIYAGWYPYWHRHGIFFYPNYRYRTYATAGSRGFYGRTRTIGSTRGSAVVRGGGRNDGGYRNNSSGGG